MAFKMVIDTVDERCDICNLIVKDKVMLRLATIGRRSDERNFIWMHLACFEPKLERAKRKAAQ